MLKRIFLEDWPQTIQEHQNKMVEFRPNLPMRLPNQSVYWTFRLAYTQIGNYGTSTSLC